MTVTLPIPDRNLQISRLTDAEINTMLAAYAAGATDPITAKFATGLATYLANRRELASEIAYKVAFTEKNRIDQYGNPAPTMDDAAL